MSCEGDVLVGGEGKWRVKRRVNMVNVWIYYDESCTHHLKKESGENGEKWRGWTKAGYVASIHRNTTMKPPVQTTIIY
jgi:hypothetical protein